MTETRERREGTGEGVNMKKDAKTLAAKG